MASVTSLALTVLEIRASKVQRTGHFLAKPPPPPYKFQKVKTKSLIFDLSKLIFK